MRQVASCVCVKKLHSIKTAFSLNWSKNDINCYKCTIWQKPAMTFTAIQSYVTNSSCVLVPKVLQFLLTSTSVLETLER